MRDSLVAELLEIEALLLDDAPPEMDRFALNGAQWQTASQTFSRVSARHSEVVSKLRH